VRTYVLDASAVVVVLRDEAGAPLVRSLMAGALMSAVNASETAARLVEMGTPASQASRAVRALNLAIVPFDADLAWRTADLRRLTRGTGLSLADRACLATAERYSAVAVTADRAWAKLKLGIDVRVIR
jgi:PIN domain nuclease of toxin-antitoxin system